MKQKMQYEYLRINYPEPEHLYLTNTKLLVCTLFPQTQESHKLHLGSRDKRDPCNNVREEVIGLFFDPKAKTVYDMVLRRPFLPDDAHEDYGIYKDYYLAEGVSREQAQILFDEYVKTWCENHQLAIIK